MVLKLNETRGSYQEFYGIITEQMPKLVAEGRIPLSVSELMQRRLDVRNAFDGVKDSWMNNYFDTGDAIVYHPDGRIKIVLDSQYLRDMTPETPRNRGALVLTSEQYVLIDGEEFKRGKLGKTEDWLSKADVKEHPVWKVLARDQALLNDYVDYIFAEGKERFDGDNAMGVFTSPVINGDMPKVDTPEMRAWGVSGLGGRSFIIGVSILDYGEGRLVGVAPEARSAKISGDNKIRTYTAADLQAVDKAMKGLEGVVNQELLKPFADLRKKL